MAKVLESFTPLLEKAIHRDGTIPIKIIQPGWGISGYYGREVLERDIPKAFPKNTQMFWNHDTLEERFSRPEGDLSRLAGVTVTDPVWEDAGADGPGMYARAKTFGQYSSAVNEIAEHIGLSIRGDGVKERGEAEGRKGNLVTEIVNGKSIDFVTVPGAGGRIVSLFEAAGREVELQEARNLGEWLESRLHLKLTEIADMLYGDGHVTREERLELSAAIGAGLDAYRDSLMAGAPQLFRRRPFDTSQSSGDITITNESARETAIARETAKNLSEDDMSDLSELQESFAESQKTIQEQDGAIAALREQLLLREAREFVTVQLAGADLPDVTKARLSMQLSTNPVVKEGKVDEEAYQVRIDAAVKEAQAEVAAVMGQTGRITGMGESAGQAGEVEQKSLEESDKRARAALISVGYGRPEVRNGQ